MADKFINIEDKENSADQQAANFNVPSKFLYTAEEWNLLRDKIEELYQITQGNIEVVAASLKHIVIAANLEGTNPNKQIHTRIVNWLNNLSAENKLYVPPNVDFTIAAFYIIGNFVIRHSFTVQQDGNINGRYFGIGEPSATSATLDIRERLVIPTKATNPNNLGDIGNPGVELNGQPISKEQHLANIFNTQDPTKPATKGDTIIAVISTVEYSYYFNGPDGIYGNNGDQATAENFIQYNSSNLNDLPGSVEKTSDIPINNGETGGSRYVEQNELGTAAYTNSGDYILLAEKGAPNGVAILDGNGKIVETQYGDLAVTDTIPATQTTLTAFVANNGTYTFQMGDIIILAADVDGNISHYLFKGGDKSLEASYSLLNATRIPISAVIGLQEALDAKELLSNKKQDIEANKTSTTFIGSIKAFYDWGVAKFATFAQGVKADNSIQYGTKGTSIGSGFITPEFVFDDALTGSFDNILSPGWYFVGNTSTETPIGIGGIWYLNVIRYANTNICQLAYTYGTGNGAGVHYRTKFQGDWSKWRELADTDQTATAAQGALADTAVQREGDTMTGPLNVNDKIIAHKFEGELFSKKIEATINGISEPTNLTCAVGTGTLPAGTYHYRVTALNAIGQTLGSNEASITLTETGGVLNSWDPVVGADFYQVFGRIQGSLVRLIGVVETTYLDDGSISSASGALLPTENDTGSYELDYAVASVFFITMNVGTTFSEINKPTGNSLRDITIYLIGNSTANFPNSWNVNKIGRIKGDEISKIQLTYISDTVIFNQTTNSLSTFPKPLLYSISPLSILPSTTSVIVIKGDFFTKSSTVDINGNTVNLVRFVDSQTLLVSVTTTSAQGDFFVSVDNGILSSGNVKLLKVYLGGVTFPFSFDWQDIVGSSTRTETGDIKITDNDVQGIATWNKLLDFSVNFELRFKIERSLFNANQTDESALDKFELLDQSVTADVFTYVFNRIAQTDPKTNQFKYSKNGVFISDLDLINEPPVSRYILMDWSTANQSLNIYSHSSSFSNNFNDRIQTLGTADGLSNTFTAKARFTVQRHDFVQIQHILKQ